MFKVKWAEQGSPKPKQKPRISQQRHQDHCEDKDAEIKKRLLSQHRKPFEYLSDHSVQSKENLSLRTPFDLRKIITELASRANYSKSRLQKCYLPQLFAWVLKRPFVNDKNLVRALEGINSSAKEQEFSAQVKLSASEASDGEMDCITAHGAGDYDAIKTVLTASYAKVVLNTEDHSLETGEAEKNLRDRLWTLHEDIEYRIVPLKHAEAEYNHIMLEESPEKYRISPDICISGEDMAAWLRSWGVPSDHITTGERAPFFSEAASPRSEILYSEGCLREHILEARKAKRDLTYYIRLFRQESISARKMYAKMEKAMGRLSGEKINILDQVRKDLETPLALADYLWDYFVDGGKPYPPDPSSSVAEAERLPSVPTREMNKLPTIVGEAISSAYKDKNFNLPSVPFSGDRPLHDDENATTLNKTEATGSTFSPNSHWDEFQRGRKRNDLGMGVAKSPQSHSQRLSSSPTRKYKDTKVRDAHEKCAATPIHEIVGPEWTYASLRSRSASPSNRPRPTKQRDPGFRPYRSSKGVLTDKLWGLPMATGKARELGRIIGLPKKHIETAYLDGISPRATSYLKVTVSPTKRKNSGSFNTGTPAKVLKRSIRTYSSSKPKSHGIAFASRERENSDENTPRPPGDSDTLVSANRNSNHQLQKPPPPLWGASSRETTKASTTYSSKTLKEDAPSCVEESHGEQLKPPTKKMTLLEYLRRRFQVNEILLWLRRLPDATDFDTIFTWTRRLVPCAWYALKSGIIGGGRDDIEVTEILKDLVLRCCKPHENKALNESFNERARMICLESSVLNSSVNFHQRPHFFPPKEPSSNMKAFSMKTDASSIFNPSLDPVLKRRLYVKGRSSEPLRGSPKEHCEVYQRDISTNQLRPGPLSTPPPTPMLRPMDYTAVSKIRKTSAVKPPVGNLKTPPESYKLFRKTPPTTDTFQNLEKREPWMISVDTSAPYRESDTSISSTCHPLDTSLCRSQPMAMSTEVSNGPPSSSSPECDSLVLPEPVWPLVPCTIGSELPQKAAMKWRHMSPESATGFAHKIALEQPCKTFSLYIEQQRAIRSVISRSMAEADSKMSVSRYFQSSNGPSAGSSSYTSNLNKLFDKYQGMIQRLIKSPYILSAR